MKKTTLLLYCSQPVHAPEPRQPRLAVPSTMDRRRYAVASTVNHYYVLHVRHSPSGARATAIALRKRHDDLDRTFVRSPIDHYKVTEHSDCQSSGIRMGMASIMANGHMPTKSPLNWRHHRVEDGVVSIPTARPQKTVHGEKPVGSERGFVRP